MCCISYIFFNYLTNRNVYWLISIDLSLKSSGDSNCNLFPHRDTEINTNLYLYFFLFYLFFVALVQWLNWINFNLYERDTMIVSKIYYFIANVRLFFIYLFTFSVELCSSDPLTTIHWWPIQMQTKYVNAIHSKQWFFCIQNQIYISCWEIKITGFELISRHPFISCIN